MTKEEEIKARLDQAEHVEYQKWGTEYCSEGGVDSLGDAEDDIRYLLARNEELQRRVEKMQAVVDSAMLIPVGMPMAIRNTDFSTAIGNIRRATKMLDAKEQDDDHAD